MFSFPKLAPYTREEIELSQFKGLDKRINATANTLSSCKNISPDAFPVVCTREKRRKVFLSQGEIITGIYFSDRAYMTTTTNGNTRLYYGNDFGSLKHGYTSEVDEKQTSLMCTFDGNICLFNLRTELGSQTMMAAPIAAIDHPTKIEAPTLTDVTVFASRIIGCRGQQIRACAQGNMLDWDYENESTPEADRAVLKGYKLTSDFTACTTYQNKALFFTNDEMYEFHGKNSKQFELMKIANVGCVNRNSVCEVEGKLYFLSTEGVMCYSGGVPKCVSAPICDAPKKNSGVLCAGASKVYACFEGKNGLATYSYCTQNSAWSIDDEMKLVSACSHNGKSYFATESIVLEVGGDDALEDIEWELETASVYCAKEGLKKRAKLELCAEGGKLAKLEAYIKFDNGEYEMLCSSLFGGVKYFCLPIARESFSKYKIKLCGKGDFKLCSMSLSYALGGEKNG